jgi:hypothetical protein
MGGLTNRKIGQLPLLGEKLEATSERTCGLDLNLLIGD